MGLRNQPGGHSLRKINTVFFFFPQRNIVYGFCQSSHTPEANTWINIAIWSKLDFWSSGNSRKLYPQPHIVPSESHWKTFKEKSITFSKFFIKRSIMTHLKCKWTPLCIAAVLSVSLPRGFLSSFLETHLRENTLELAVVCTGRWSSSWFRLRLYNVNEDNGKEVFRRHVLHDFWCSSSSFILGWTELEVDRCDLCSAVDLIFPD